MPNREEGGKGNYKEVGKGQVAGHCVETGRTETIPVDGKRRKEFEESQMSHTFFRI